MFWLALAAACGLAIATIFKWSEGRGLDRVALLTVNYAAAMILAAALDARTNVLPGASPGFLALGVSVGVLFIAGFVIFSYAIREAGMALATSTMRLAVVIPVLASWLIWGEVPSALQATGLALAGVAFFLITRPAQPRALATEAAASPVPVPEVDGPVGRPDAGASGTDWRRAAVALVALFISGGLVDTSMKAFDELYAADYSRAGFMLLVFGVAFLCGVGFVVRQALKKGTWPSGLVVGAGIVLGLINYGSVEFLLRAIEALSGPVVFPLNNIAIVMGAALLGVTVWGESLSRLNWAGLALAAAALVLIAR